MSPTELSLRHLRAEGWLVDVCERWVPNPVAPAGGNRRDLFGMIDLIGIRDGVTLAVQTTSDTNVSARVAKISDEEHAERLAALRAAGWRIVVHGWRKADRATGRTCHHPGLCGCRWAFRLIDLTEEAPA